MDDLFNAIDSGAVILTSTIRLSRSLTEADDARRIRRGDTHWQSPAILPYRSWLTALWHADPQPSKALLRPWQEHHLWRNVILESQQGAELLAVSGAARAAAKAWRIANAWRLPLTPSWFDTQEDAAAFLDWSRQYTTACERHEWLDSARLSDALSVAIREHRIELPKRIVLAGFVELDPQQREFLQSLERAGTESGLYEPQALAGTASRFAAADRPQELRAAAEFARHVLEREPVARIAVVASDLTTIRTRLERTFLEVLHPDALSEPRRGPRAFHLAAGASLASHPVIHTALLILRLASGSLPLAEMGSLLRSPFLGGALEERSARALLDASLRRDHPVRIFTTRLADFSRRRSPILARLLARWERARRGFAAKALPSAWSLRFSRLLAAFEWPGADSLSTDELQAYEAGREVLSRFASLDALTGPIPLSEALELFEEMAAADSFQSENLNQPVQVLSVAETRGLTFDYVWMLGMTGDEWPPPPSPHPFLPVALQRQRNLPHSSAQREREDAAAAVMRLRESAARHIVFSHASGDGERQHLPSPLIAKLPAFLPDTPQPWLDWFPAAELQRLPGYDAPPIEPGTRVAGGVRILQHQAACPFRAFAEIRLGARALEQGEAGFNPRDRGTFVHRTLETVWRDLETRDRLLATNPSELEALIRAAVRAVFPATADPFTLELQSIEQDRIVRLVTAWLDIERKRSPFRVLGREEKRTLRVGSLDFDARLDRVDELEDLSHVLIDYKTGASDARAWEGDRPDEPQMPVYAVTHPQRVAAVALASVTKEEPHFSGVASRHHVLPDVEAGDLSARITDWKRVLERLSDEFAAGKAAVDPKYPLETCKFCDLPALCRVAELRRGSADETEAEG